MLKYTDGAGKYGNGTGMAVEKWDASRFQGTTIDRPGGNSSVIAVGQHPIDPHNKVLSYLP
jgi:hypothetical protein